jgi:hypothetical protein
MQNIPDKKEKLMLQAVLFDKNYYTPSYARHYLKISKIPRLKKVHETDQYYRYRIREPEDFDETTFRTVNIGPNIKYVMGKLKN